MAEDITGTEAFTNGAYQKPEDKDRGNDVFSVLEAFMDRMAAHSHTGADSKEISLNIEKNIATFVNGVDHTWASVSDGLYRAQLPVVVGVDYDLTIRKFFYKSGVGADDYVEFFPKVERIDDSNYYIYSNDNALSLKVVTL